MFEQNDSAAGVAQLGAADAGFSTAHIIIIVLLVINLAAVLWIATRNTPPR